MTTEPCPTCKGVCCVNKYGSPVDHGSALALHSCPKCDNDRGPNITSAPSSAPSSAPARIDTGNQKA
jgi:hypothetical protein